MKGAEEVLTADLSPASKFSTKINLSLPILIETDSRVACGGDKSDGFERILCYFDFEESF